MLEEILRYLKNWFVMPDGIREGRYAIEGGALALPFLQAGQYFRICESRFNDGLHRYPATELTDEVFEGTVWALAVPKAVIELSGEIEAWQREHGASGAYLSESFGGYSYTHAVNAKTGQAAGWQDVFRNRLGAWRKVREL